MAVIEKAVEERVNRQDVTLCHLAVVIIKGYLAGFFPGNMTRFLKN